MRCRKPALEFPEQGARIALQATVVGSRIYAGSLLVNEYDDLEGECDCAHAQDGSFCKHQVALALTLRGLLSGDAPGVDPQAQETVPADARRTQTLAGRRDALRTFGQTQNAAVLAERLWAWAESARHLTADLRAWAAQSRASDDPRAMKAVISDLLRSDGFLDWRESGSYAARAEKVLPFLDRVQASDAVQASALSHHALRRRYAACEEADDSGGAIGEVVMSLMELLSRSYPRTRATPGVTGRDVGARVAWLLADGRVDDALALVQPPHVCQPLLLRAIAK